MLVTVGGVVSGLESIRAKLVGKPSAATAAMLSLIANVLRATSVTKIPDIQMVAG